MSKNKCAEIITIDGPAAVGKTTVGKGLANRLGYVCFDTGVMYRALTYAVINSPIDYDDEARVSQLAWDLSIDILPPSRLDGRLNDIMIGGKDCTWEIRHPSVNQLVSEISAYPEVRKALTEQQRRIAEKGKMVVLGRDIGSIVLPDAPCKIFMTASAEVRAKRRFEEERYQERTISYEDVLSSIKHRDQIDGSRKAAPMVIPEDALVIDTDDLEISQVIAMILRHCGCENEGDNRTGNGALSD